MAPRKKPPVLPPFPVRPTEPAQPPEAPDPATRLSQLDERVRTAAIRSKVRKRIGLDLKVDEYEQLVEIALEHGEDLVVVVRACVRFGLRHYQQWASKASGISPFGEGDMRPRRPGDYDPTGLMLAPPLEPPFRGRFPVDGASVPLRGFPGTQRFPDDEVVDVVFSPPPPPSPADRAFIPNGATVGGAVDGPIPPSTPFPEMAPPRGSQPPEEVLQADFVEDAAEKILAVSIEELL